MSTIALMRRLSGAKLRHFVVSCDYNLASLLRTTALVCLGLGAVEALGIAKPEPASLQHPIIIDGKPALELTTADGWSTVIYSSRNGQPAFGFSVVCYQSCGFVPSTGTLYIGKERLIYETTGKGGFDVPREQLQKWSEDWTINIEFTSKKRYVFQLLLDKQGRRLRVGYSPQKWASLALDDFAAAKNQFEKLTTNLSTSASQEQATKQPAPFRTASLILSSQPSSVQVYLENKYKGVTNEQEGKLVVDSLSPGSYNLRLSRTGYKDWTKTITLDPGGELNLDAELVSSGPAPLTLGEVEDALKNGVPKNRIAALVNQFGVGFLLSAEAEQRLRNAGADDGLLLSIAKHKK